MERALAVVVAVSLGAGCATASARPELEDLKPLVKKFHQHLRWRDFRGAAELLEPRLRAGFVLARQQARDEEDLTITDYELEEARLDRGANVATVVSRLSWYRLPNTSVKTATVTTRFTYADQLWLISGMEGGPFPDLASRDAGR